MKHLLKLLCSLFLFCTISAHAQKEKVEFPYSHDSLVELLKDTNWLKASAEKYMEYVKNGDIKRNGNDLLASYIILNQNEEGLQFVSKKIEKMKNTFFSSSWEKIMSTIFYGYFYTNLHPGTTTYLNAVNRTFSELSPSDEDRRNMHNEQVREDTVYPNAVMNNFYNTDEYLLEDFKRFSPSFDKTRKALNALEISGILRMIAFKKVALAVKDEQDKLANQQEKNATSKHPLSNSVVINKIDKTILASLKPDEPGAVVVIMRGDSVLINKGYGVADINTKEKLSAETNFNIGSISKTFTATAILLLLQEGKLKLEDRIIKYLPDVNPKIGNIITIYQLLTHTSGLPRYIPSKDSIRGLKEMDLDTYNSDKNLDSLLFEPGLKYSYSNIGYRWLALITEKISEMPFGDFVRKNIFLKAGMQNSYELNRDKPIPHFAHAYQRVDSNFIEYDYGEEQQFSTLGDGGVVTSANDMIAWETALRNNKILSKDLFEESITPRIRSEEMLPNSSYGFGWFIENNADGPKIYSHSGGNGAFVSYFFRIPEKKIMVAIFCNTDDRHMGYYLEQYIRTTLNNAGWY